jgi:spore coat protein U-like protein
MRVPLLLLLSLAVWPTSAGAQTCTYTVSPTIDFGTIVSLATPQIDVTATISVTCTGPFPGLNSARVCLSIPAGTGGASIADRRMLSGASFVQYQLYQDAARTQIWGALGGTSPPQTLDFPNVVLAQTQNVTVYGRVFVGQTGKFRGTYLSDLTPIQSRVLTYLVAPAACTTINTAATTLPTMTSKLVINTSCTIAANPLNYGTVTSITGSLASTNLSANCSLNAPYAIALDGGSISNDVNARRMRLGAGPNTIDYQLYRDSARLLIWGNTTGLTLAGTGSGSAQSIPVYGSVPAQGIKPTGVYNDTITVTITF